MTESVEREAEMLAADAIGDVIEHWGFRKPLGRVWTVLYLADDALCAAELGERLAMSAGAVSMSLTELQRWGVVRRVWKPGERKEFYEAETDFWKMISRVVHDRERSLAASVRERLESARGLLRRALDGGQPRAHRARRPPPHLRRGGRVGDRVVPRVAAGGLLGVRQPPPAHARRRRGRPPRKQGVRLHGPSRPPPSPDARTRCSAAPRRSAASRT